MAKDELGRSPLALAAAAPSVALVKLFVQVENPRIDIHTTDNSGQTLLMNAAYGCVQMKEGIRNIHGDWTEAAEVMRFLIDSGADADVNKRDAGGNTVLHLAVREPAMLAMLLKTVGGAGGLDTSAVNNGGWTALHMAAADGCSEWTIEALMKAGADIEARDAEGRTPLLLAANRGLRYHVEPFREKGANMKATDKKGQTALHYMVRLHYHQYFQSDDLRMVRFLVDSGVNVDGQDAEGNTALHTAAEKGRRGTVDALLHCGADPEVRDNEGRTALLRAAAALHRPVVDALFQKGADIHATDRSGETALHKAIYSPMKRFIQILRERDVWYEVRGRGKLTIRHSNHQAVWDALGAGELIGFTEGSHGYSYEEGITMDPYQNRAPAGVVKLLLKKGANVMIVDKEGKTPLQKAIESEDEDLEELLRFPEVV
jgi:ankyrin repeat protein